MGLDNHSLSVESCWEILWRHCRGGGIGRTFGGKLPVLIQEIRYVAIVLGQLSSSLPGHLFGQKIGYAFGWTSRYGWRQCWVGSWAGGRVMDSIGPVISFAEYRVSGAVLERNLACALFDELEHVVHSPMAQQGLRSMLSTILETML